MSPHQHVALAATLGGGWVARSAEFVEGPSSIVLVTVERDADRRRLRLDVGKAMFLDEPPGEIEPHAARALTDDIARHVAPARGGPGRA